MRMSVVLVLCTLAAVTAREGDWSPMTDLVTSAGEVAEVRAAVETLMNDIQHFIVPEDGINLNIQRYDDLVQSALNLGISVPREPSDSPFVHLKRIHKAALEFNTHCIGDGSEFDTCAKWKLVQFELLRQFNLARPKNVESTIETQRDITKELAKQRAEKLWAVLPVPPISSAAEALASPEELADMKANVDALLQNIDNLSRNMLAQTEATPREENELCIQRYDNLVQDALNLGIDFSPVRVPSDSILVVLKRIQTAAIGFRANCTGDGSDYDTCPKGKLDQYELLRSSGVNRSLMALESDKFKVLAERNELDRKISEFSDKLYELARTAQAQLDEQRELLTQVATDTARDATQILLEAKSIGSRAKKQQCDLACRDKDVTVGPGGIQIDYRIPPAWCATRTTDDDCLARIQQDIDESLNAVKSEVAEMKERLAML